MTDTAPSERTPQTRLNLRKVDGAYNADHIHVPFDDDGPLVVVEENMPSNGFQDYVARDPSRKLRRDQVGKGKLRQSIDDQALFLENCEYRSARDQKAVREQRSKRSKRVVLEVLRQYKQKIKSYKKAIAYCEASSDEQKASPKPKLKKAMAIAKAGPPITLEQAKKKALHIIMSQECR